MYPFIPKNVVSETIDCVAKEMKMSKDEVKKSLKQNQQSIIDEFKTNGVVVVKNVIPHDMVHECVKDIWGYILNLPWIPEIKKQWVDIHASMKNDYWREVSAKESAQVKKVYPMTGAFGALTRSPAFHLKTQWEVRQNPYIASVFASILGTKDLMVSIDRISFKYPKQGEAEFEHWDSNPYYWHLEKYEGVQGILALSDTSFFAVPKTHTMEFRDQFISQYPPGKKTDSEYRIDKTKDPMGLYGSAKEYPLKKGDLVIWSARLLHQARKNVTKRVRYAYFINYFPWGQPQDSVLRQFGNNVDRYIDDRIHSYNTGMNPTYFPSGFKVALYSKMAYNFHPEAVTRFSEMFTKGNEEVKKKNGTTVKVPVEWNPLELGFYEPPELTPLGKYFLGLSTENPMD